jgi:hypothetical protein
MQMTQCWLDGTWCCGIMGSNSCCDKRSRISLAATFDPSATTTPPTQSSSSAQVGPLATTTPPTQSSSSAQQPISEGSKIGIGVGVGIGSLGLAALLAAFVILRRRHSKEQGLAINGPNNPGLDINGPSNPELDGSGAANHTVLQNDTRLYELASYQRQPSAS